MRVKIKLSQPFRNVIGQKEIIITSKKDNLTLFELIKLLIEEKPKLEDYLLSDDNEKMFRRFIVVKDNKMLNLNSEINNDDTLKILSPLHGG